MTIVLKKGSSQKEIQRKLLDFQKKPQAKKYEIKKRIVEATFGSVAFDENKTASEIYKEMRDEWS